MQRCVHAPGRKKRGGEGAGFRETRGLASRMGIDLIYKDLVDFMCPKVPSSLVYTFHASSVVINYLSRHRLSCLLYPQNCPLLALFLCLWIHPSLSLSLLFYL